MALLVETPAFGCAAERPCWLRHLPLAVQLKGELQGQVTTLQRQLADQAVAATQQEREASLGRTTLEEQLAQLKASFAGQQEQSAGLEDRAAKLESKLARQQEVSRVLLQLKLPRG